MPQPSLKSVGSRAVAEIRVLYEYDHWANRRIRGACSALSEEERQRDLGSSFPSVLATLQHILAAEWIWLERWNGRSPSGAPADWASDDWEALERRWSELEAAQHRFVIGLTDDDLERVLAYRNTRGDPFAAPLSELLRHVVNHSTYHRGQVATMLRQLGASVPATDLVLFQRERPRA